MEAQTDQLARKIVQAYQTIPPDQRLLVGIAGPPGSGKSTLAYPLTDKINALLLSHPPSHPSHFSSKSSDLVEPDSDQGKGDEVAVCVGLDGWHYSRLELDGFEDPVEAHWRRGAAFTFNLPSYLTFLQQLRLPLSGPSDPSSSDIITSTSTSTSTITLPSKPNPSPSSPTSSSTSTSTQKPNHLSPKAIPFPTFNHALKDPSPSLTPITPEHRIIIIEGLYTLLSSPGWKECAEMLDIRIWIEVDLEVERRRLIRRNFEAGIVDDLVKCAERVEAVDMKNGEEVRNNRVEPTDVVVSIDEEAQTADVQT